MTRKSAMAPAVGSSREQVIRGLVPDAKPVLSVGRSAGTRVSAVARAVDGDGNGGSVMRQG